MNINQFLTVNDLNEIVESLNYTRKSYEEYDKYPSYKDKQERIRGVEALIGKVNSLKKALLDQA